MRLGELPTSNTELPTPNAEAEREWKVEDRGLRTENRCLSRPLGAYGFLDPTQGVGPGLCCFAPLGL